MASSTRTYPIKHGFKKRFDGIQTAAISATSLLLLQRTRSGK
jgi:hypothetical protein